MDQVRRSACSVGWQIAEAWAKRRYENHFVSKLADSFCGEPTFQVCKATAEYFVLGEEV